VDCQSPRTESEGGVENSKSDRSVCICTSIFYLYLSWGQEVIICRKTRSQIPFATSKPLIQSLTYKGSKVRRIAAQGLLRMDSHDPTLQEWRDGSASPLLWIKGDPGKGKTMLMIALARELVKSAPQNPRTVAFFFCQNTDPRLNTAASILRGLIYMLAKDDQMAKFSTPCTSPTPISSMVQTLYMLCFRHCQKCWRILLEPSFSLTH